MTAINEELDGSDIDEDAWLRAIISDLPHDRWTPVNSVQGSLERFGAFVIQ
jgi:hypothetical protein